MEQFLNTSTLAVAVLILLATNLILIFWISRISGHYNNLTKGLEKKTLMSVLEGIQKTLVNHERTLVINKKEIAKVVDDGRLHLSQMSLKRFNPFSDTGGDQSFMLSILDGNKDGVVITSLHSRENTRFYVKSVKGGEGIEHPLSKEEQKIVNK